METTTPAIKGEGRRVGRISAYCPLEYKGMIDIDVGLDGRPYRVRFMLKDCAFEPAVGDEVAFYCSSFRAVRIKKLAIAWANVVSLDLGGSL